MEQKLLAAVIQSREAFDEVLSTEIDGDFSEQAVIIWDTVKDYYGTDPEAAHVDKDIIKKRLTRKYPKHKDVFSNYLDTLPDVSSVNVIKEAIDVKLDSIRHKLAQEFVAGNNTQSIDSLLEKYNKLRMGELDAEHKSAEVYVNARVGSILKSGSLDNRIAILPESLNIQIKGGALPGHHVVVFAPTEMGKSLFGLNMAYGFIKQGKKTLYVGNEDPATDMIYRFMWRVTGMTDEEIQQDPERADKILDEKGYGNFIFVETEAGTPRELEELVKEYEPDVLMVDQIRNLDMGEVNKVIALEKAASTMRRLGKKYGMLTVSFTQAADSATGKAILSRGDIDFSNVGIPGTADLLIGIGATEDMEMKGERLLSFIKNKIGGDKNPVRVWFDNKLTKVQ